MFKRGQLVRLKRDGRMFVVEAQDILYVSCTPIKKRILSRLFIEAHKLELVGNNYKAK